MRNLPLGDKQVGGAVVQGRTVATLAAVSALAAGAIVFIDTPALVSSELEIVSVALARTEERPITSGPPEGLVSVGGPEPLRTPLAYSEFAGAGAVEPDRAHPIHVSAILVRARAFIALRDIMSARALLTYAARSNQPEVWVALAQTYDHIKLSEWKATGARPDPDHARRLYARAEALRNDRSSADPWAKLQTASPMADAAGGSSKGARPWTGSP